MSELILSKALAKIEKGNRGKLYVRCFYLLFYLLFRAKLIKSQLFVTMQVVATLARSLMKKMTTDGINQQVV